MSGKSDHGDVDIGAVENPVPVADGEETEDNAVKKAGGRLGVVLTDAEATGHRGEGGGGFSRDGLRRAAGTQTTSSGGFSSEAR